MIFCNIPVLRRFLVLVPILMLGLLGNVPAQDDDDGPPAVHIRERMMQVKKIKLIGVLDMDEVTAEKFFVKYNLAQNNIEEAHKALDGTLTELQQAIAANETARIKELTDKSLKNHAALQEAVGNMFTSVRSVLSEVQFAKLIVFESRFQEEVRRRLMEMNRERRRDRDDDDKPKKRRQ